MTTLLGDPTADPDSPDGVRMRFANLGACGPDIFYAMADYGGDVQDLENFFVKLAGTFTCLGELMGEVNRYVEGVESQITLGVSDSLRQTFNLIKAALNEGLLALIVGPIGANFWPAFEAARQKDCPREKWFWADYLHYIKSGQFVRALIDNARTSGNSKLLAYAYGYLTHYVTDVVGHPYVNQVVQAPWRLYWQRHHLVENFMDAYTWDRWHVSNPEPQQPSTEEQPLDTLVAAPNPVGQGAPLTFSRLNDHINIGSIAFDGTAGDSVDELVEKVCQEIKQGLFDVGIAENIAPAVPNDPDFKDWCNLVSTTIRQVYDSKTGRVPNNLAQSVIPGAPPRTDGYPTPDDVAGAYGIFRLILRTGTEEKIKEPTPPDIMSDISAAVDQLANDLQNNLGNFPPPPNINTGGGFSWHSLWHALKAIAEWLGEVLEAVGKTVFDFLADVISGAVTVVTDAIKYALYLLNKALFSIYNAFRDVLVYAGYSLPHTDGLFADIGGGHNARTLWCSMGNLVNYPVEEIPEERKKFFSDYAPIVPPAEQQDSVNPLGGFFFEHPSLPVAAPYSPPGGDILSPDVFLVPGVGADDMFNASGPQQPLPTTPPSIATVPRNFGGAVANSIKGIQLAEQGFPAASELPDYNLDGDRSYAWPCWDVTDPAPANSSSSNPITTTPLRPEATNQTDPSVHEALVSVIPVTG